MRILIATDLSEEAAHAARWGAQFARRAAAKGLDVQVHVAHITGSWYPTVGTGSLLDDADARLSLERAVESWMSEQVDEEFAYDVLLAEGRPWKALRELVSEIEADWIVNGMSGQGAVARMVVGSTTHKLAHDPPCNLAIVHPEHVDWSGDIRLMAAVDFSQTSRRSLELAIRIAARYEAPLHILHVVYPPGPIAMPDGFVGYSSGEYQSLQTVQNRAEISMNELLSDYEALLKSVQWSSQVSTGYPTKEIVSLVREDGYDGVFLGTVGRSGFDDFVLGSVASGVVKNMACSVFLTPPTAPKM